MKGFYLIAAVLAALPVHATSAQDETVEVDLAPPARPAGGFRAEILLGYDTDGFENGMLYGGRIGYDFRVTPGLLLGIDGELNDVTTDQEFNLAPQPGTLVLEDGPDAYVGARATLVLSRRFSIYGGAGYSRARQSFFFLINPNQPLGPVGGEESYQDGYRVSAGGQLNIGRRAFLGAEYRYSNYEDGFFQREQWVGSIGFRF
jgi:outer membrane immunogenic protein